MAFFKSSTSVFLYLSNSSFTVLSLWEIKCLPPGLRRATLEPAYFLEHRSQPGIGAEMREHRIGDITKDFKRLPANRRVGVRDLMGSVLVSLPRRAVPTRSAPDAVRPFQITCSQGAVPTRRLEHGVVPAHHQDIAVADLGEKMAFHGEHEIRPHYMGDFVILFRGVVVVAVEQDGAVTETGLSYALRQPGRALRAATSRAQYRDFVAFRQLQMHS